MKLRVKKTIHPDRPTHWTPKDWRHYIIGELAATKFKNRRN